MNIAIVDDEKVELETAEVFLRAYVRKFFHEHESEIHIEVFRSDSEFVQVFCAGWYQLIVLGTRMRDLADFIRARGEYDAGILFLELNDNFGGGGDL